MKLLSLFFFLFSTFASDVIDLNPEIFKKEVLESQLPYFVEFFAPWCGHCQRLAPEWEKAATNLKGIIPVGKVDCTVHQNLCGQYQVQGYPTIKIFSEKGKKIEDYQQARQAASIVRAAIDGLPNSVTFVNSIENLEKFLNNVPSIPHVLIFSAKSDVSPILKSLALVFKNRILFSQIKKESTEIIEKYSITTFPSILVLSSNSEEPTFYNGAINAEELKKFFSSFAGETVVENPPPVKPKPKPTKVEASFIKITEENIDENCGSGLCILGFVDFEGETVNPEHQKILDEILSKFKSDGKFKFGFTNSEELKNKFSISESNVIVFNGKKQKYVKAENFEWKNIFRTIEHVLTGDAQYISL